MTGQDDQAAVRAGEVLPAFLAGMPPHLRLAASGGELTGEMLARRRQLDANADAAAAAERLAAQAAFRQRAWEAACPLRYRSASVTKLHPQQDPGGVVSGWLASGSRMLLLHGPQQRGKTHAAWAVAAAARAAGDWVAGGRLTELLRQLRPSDTDPARPDRVRARLATADLTVLDDLGREKTTETVVEHVWDLLEARLSAGLRTIVVTNLEEAEIRDRYGDPTLSRLTETGAAVPVVGAILRPEMF